MEKNVSAKDKETPQPQGNFFSGFSGFSSRLFGIAKLVLGICCLPFVYTASLAFLNQFALVGKEPRYYFWSGVIAMLIIYLFIWEPAVIYIKGQNLVELAFNFLRPLVRIAPYVLPVYTVVLFVLYLFLSSLFKLPASYFLFLAGLTITLHLIFSAKTIRSKKDDYLKANYIFGFSLVYIINLSLLSFCLSIIFEKFSFVNFCNFSFQIATGILSAVFKRLFL